MNILEKEIERKDNEETIVSKIIIVRGHKVIMDIDLAQLYEVETKYLKRQVKRNINRFPDDFMFELTEQEFKNLRSQFGTSSWGGNRYTPMAFTEQGVAMLSGIVNSGIAVNMNIQIMRTFVEMRTLAHHNKKILESLQHLQEKFGEHDVQLKQIYETLENLLDEKNEKEEWNERQRIGFRK